MNSTNKSFLKIISIIFFIILILLGINSIVSTLLGIYMGRIIGISIPYECSDDFSSNNFDFADNENVIACTYTPSNFTWILFINETVVVLSIIGIFFLIKSLNGIDKRQIFKQLLSISLGVVVCVGCFYFLFHQRINAFLHFRQYESAFKTFSETSDKNNLSKQDPPYYYNIDTQYKNSIVFTYKDFKRSVDEFYSWHIVYISSDDVNDIPMCSLDGYNHKVAKNWYICKTEWN